VYADNQNRTAAVNSVKTIEDTIRKRLCLDKNLLIVYSVTLTAILSVSSLSPAFPRIVEELGVSRRAVGLLITVFTLPGVALTPVLGIFADRYGRKRILVPSLLLFGIAGGSCAFVSQFSFLLALRFLQGIGGAALGSLNVTIIGDLFSGKERTAAMGYNSSVLSIGTATYPAIGGALATLGWYYPFFLAFLGIPVGIMVLFSLNNPEPQNRQRLRDYLRNLWLSLKDRRVVALFIASTVTFIILYGTYLTYFPLLIAEKFGSSPLVIGLVMSAMSATTAVTSSQLGRLARVFSERTLLRVSFLIYGIALAVIPGVPSLRMLLVPTIIYGIAHGVNIPCIISLLSGMAPMEYRAAFMSANGMVLRLGQTLGPLLMGFMYALRGLDGAFFAGTALGVCMFILLGFLFTPDSKG